MKTSYKFLLSALAVSILTACDEKVDEPQPYGNPVISNITEIPQAYFADSLKIAATVSDADNVDLSTLKVSLLFGEERVAEQTIRTKIAGAEYTASLYVPFLANIPDGTATLQLVLENISGAKTTIEKDVRITRPAFDNITFVTTEGKEYSLAPQGSNVYSITTNFERKVSGFIKTPAYGTNGNELTFGMSGSQITLGATKPITFSNSSAGEYTISFNTFTFEGSPFISVSNLVDFSLGNTTDADLSQGEVVTFSGIDPAALWLSPDFFVENTDGSYTFNAISGTYRLIVDEDLGYVRTYPVSNDEPTTLADDGSGALWIIGEGIGQPSVKNNEVGWTTEKAIAFAQVDNKKYQITLVAGKSITADRINFKFFGQMGWGVELTGDKLTSTSDIVLVGTGEGGHDNGNLYIADEKALDANGIYTFTVDMTAGLNAAVLSVEKIGEVEIVDNNKISVNGTELTSLDGEEYTATLSLEQGSAVSISGINDIDSYWFNPDYFSGSANNLTLNAVSGNYNISIDIANHTITALSEQNTLTADGHGTIWILGYGAGSPSLAYEAGWNPGKGVAMPEVANNIFTLTATIGEEGEATLGTRLRTSGWDMKFFFQNGWGDEFSADKGNNIALDENAQLLLKNPSGNIGLLDGVELEIGATYKLTIDLTAGVDKGVLSFEKQ